MIRTRLQPGEAPLAQPLDHGAPGDRDIEAALDFGAQIDTAPADDLVDLDVWAVEHPLTHLAHLRLGQLARRAEGLARDQAIHAKLIVAVYPVAQRLAVHTGLAGGVSP